MNAGFIEVGKPERGLVRGCLILALRCCWARSRQDLALSRRRRRRAGAAQESQTAKPRSTDGLGV